MGPVEMFAPLLAAVLALGTTPSETFICVEWAGHPHGYDVPIYYWNSAHQAYVWHGADCSMFPNGQALNCNPSRIMGTAGNDMSAYNAIQGSTDVDYRKRMAFFKSCRITVNTLEKDDGAWIFRQNGASQASAGSCTETNVVDCTGKFASAIRITAGTAACLSSERGARDYRGYFASIKDRLVDGLNPVLNMPTTFKVMVDGGIKCDAADGLPRFDRDNTGIYGVMSWNNSNAIPLFQQVMPTPECVVTFPASAADNLVVGGGTNRICKQNYDGRRLNGEAAVSAMLLLQQSNIGSSASSRVGLATWVFIALAITGVRTGAK